jgi:hypothetical protein
LDEAFLGLEEESSPAGFLVTFFSFSDFAISTRDLQRKISESFLYDQIIQ